MKKSKLINLICSLTLAAVLVLIVLLIVAMNSMDTRRLIISSENAQTVYDGNTLSANVWKLESGELKKGHKLSVKVTGSQKNVGTSQNMFYVTVTDSVGADVTSDYIIEPHYGSLTVLPKEITISTASASKIYDGEPLTCDEWTYLPEDGLVPGHTLEVELSGTITEIGFTPNKVGSAIIRDERGKDVTYNYDITVDTGTLIVYDPSGGGGGGGIGDLPVLGGGFGNVPEEPFICLRVKAEKTGLIYLKLQSFGDYTGNDWLEAESSEIRVFKQYSADYLTGFALGSADQRVNIKSLIEAYALPYYMFMYGGSYDIQSSDTKYEGNTEKTYTVDISEYDYGSILSVPTEYIDFEREYREYVYKTYLTVDDYTATYMESIIESEGFVNRDLETYLRVAAYIQNSAKYNLTYDSALDLEPNVAVAFLDRYKEGICQHYASAATLLFRTMGVPARYTVGFAANTEGGKWVDVTSQTAHAWVEIYIDGMGWVQLEVTGGESSGGGGGSFGNPDAPTEIEVAPIDVEKKFDGKKLSAVAEIRGFEEFEALGYTYSVIVKGSRTNPGKTQTEIEKIQLFDPQGNDVTNEFFIKTTPGTIHIYLEIITIGTDGINKIYDGIAIQTNMFGVRIDGKFASDHVSDELLSGIYSGEYGEVRLVLSAPSTQKNVGTIAASFKAEIYDSKNNLITDNYKIKKECGELTVTPCAITVEAGSATKEYDGEALICDQYTLFGNLADGDYISVCVTEGSQTIVGRSENLVKEIVIMNKDGEDVTRNYSIKLMPGTLRVTAPQVTY